jgi:Fic family protein
MLSLLNLFLPLRASIFLQILLFHLFPINFHARRKRKRSGRERKPKLHPVLLAAEMHERVVTVHPFIDGNGRTSRLIMNLILLKHGFVIANIKGDSKSRMEYYNALEVAQSEGNKIPFLEFIAETELTALQRYLSIIGQ